MESGTPYTKGIGPILNLEMGEVEKVFLSLGSRPAAKEVTI